MPVYDRWGEQIAPGDMELPPGDLDRTRWAQHPEDCPDDCWFCAWAGYKRSET